MKTRKPIRFINLWGVFAIIVVLAGSCASTSGAYHKHVMRGSIVEAKGKNIVVCIGSNDGAKEGQVFSVYWIKKTSHRQKQRDIYKRVPTGKVKISKIIDTHFAQAQIIEGKAKMGSIVELHR